MPTPITHLCFAVLCFKMLFAKREFAIFEIFNTFIVDVE